MPTLPTALEALQAELGQFGPDQTAAWLRRVFANREHRLSGRDVDASQGLRAEWPNLSPLVRRNIGEALAGLLSQYLDNPGWPEDDALEMLYLCRDLQPPPVGTRLRNLLQPFFDDADAGARARFDTLPPSVQASVLEVMRAWRPPLPAEFWRRLAERDPVRFALPAFFALAASSWAGALQILPLLPAEPTQLKTLAFSVDWLSSVVPPNSAWLDRLAETLPDADPRVAQALQEALVKAHMLLPVHRFRRVNRSALYTLRLAEPLEVEQPFALCACPA